MKALRYILGAAAIAAALSCEKEPQTDTGTNGDDNEVVTPADPVEREITVTVKGTFAVEGATCTYGDRITYATDVDKAVETELASDGTFKAKVSAKATVLDVTYGTELPAGQAYVGGKFDYGALPFKATQNIGEEESMTVTAAYDFAVVKYELPAESIVEGESFLKMILKSGEETWTVSLGEGITEPYVYIAIPCGAYSPVVIVNGTKAQYEFAATELAASEAKLYTHAFAATDLAARHILVREGEDLAAALAAAVAGDDIRLALGTFKGVYDLVDGVSIYGGWNADFTAVEGKTVLDGEQKGVVLNSKSNFTNPAVYSDLEIRNGKSESDGGGALLRKNMTLQNSIITANEGKNGAGVYVREGGVVRNCVISGNKASGKGGGVQIYKLGTLENCSVINNTAASDGGGMRLNTGGDILNCLFAGNVCEGDGASGIAVNGDARNRLINVTIAGNHNTKSGSKTYGIYYDNNGRMTNCLIHGNTVEGTENPVQAFINHKYPYLWNNAVTKGGISFHADYDTQRNADTIDLEGDVFTDAANGDYSLKVSAACIDKGAVATVSVLQNKFEEEAAFIAAFTSDLAGKVRISGEGIDCGCYEYQK